jgi:hypothetical protein
VWDVAEVLIDELVQGWGGEVPISLSPREKEELGAIMTGLRLLVQVCQSRGLGLGGGR